jgi:hypothetical protein
MPVDDGSTIADISGVSPTEVYACSWPVFRYDGASWTRLPNRDDGGIYGLYFDSTDNGFGVGNYGNIIHFER